MPGSMPASTNPTGKVLTEKHGYGNTTNLEVNKAAGLTYGDKLVLARDRRELREARRHLERSQGGLTPAASAI